MKTERERREEAEGMIVLFRVCCWGSIEQIVQLLCHIKHTKCICRYNKNNSNDTYVYENRLVDIVHNKRYIRSHT